MSKKRRRKYQQYQQSSPSQPSASSPEAGSAINSSPAPSGAVSAHAGEYRIIRNDLIRVVIVNVVFLVAVLAVYFTNRQSGYLETLFNRFL